MLRTFALALREAANWDQNPLIGPAIFLSAPQRMELSESMRELVAVADTRGVGRQEAGLDRILDNEFSQAKRIQDESVSLKFREVEQAAVVTFCTRSPWAKPPGHGTDNAAGGFRPDKIELEKGLSRWLRQAIGSTTSIPRYPKVRCLPLAAATGRT